MLVAGLLATVLTYSVLREAGGRGTDETVAAVDIQAGQTAAPSLFTTANVKAPQSALAGILSPKDVDAMSGQVATVDIKKGQLVARQQFRPAIPSPPRMAIAVDPQTIPGGPSSLVPGSRIDLVAMTKDGLPFVIPGLLVLKTPDSASDRTLGAATTVRIDVAVPDPTTAQQILAATTSGGKFVIRVSGGPGTG
jgi:hypothetical protein